MLKSFWLIKSKTKIAIKLSLLSAFIGEVVSGSTPPLEILNPLTFLFLWGFYGSGVLLVRELWVRWGGNLTSLMLLGIAYGIAEEGLAVKSFFDPHWIDLGKLAEYGRFAGVNFVWAVWLSIFHAVFSISIPILLIHIFHAEYREEPFLSSKSMKLIFSLFLFISLLIFAFLNPYPPPPFQYLLVFLTAVYFIKLAQKFTQKTELPALTSDSKNFIYGAFFTFSMFFFFFLVPETAIPAIIPCIAGIYLVIKLYKRLEGLRSEPKQTFILISGLLTPFLLFFDIIAELNGDVGMAAVGILTFAILLLSSKKLPKDLRIYKK